jgi:hypothetical protein
MKAKKEVLKMSKMQTRKPSLVELGVLVPHCQSLGDLDNLVGLTEES